MGPSARPAGRELVVNATPPAPPTPTAAKLVVQLPPSGVLHGEALGLSGSTDVKNALTINGADVPLNPDGTFFYRLPLTAPETKLVVQAKDPEGDVATLARTFTVDQDGVFMLGLVEGDLGQGAAHLEGGDRVDFAEGQLFAQGRAAGYVSGRWAGDKVLSGFFSRYDLSASLDTSRHLDGDFARELVDPTRAFALYGDSGLEVQDAATRGPLYARLTADQSSATVGDFSPGVPGGGLFRYDRMLYGVDVDFHKKLAEKYDTRLAVFAALGDARLRHGHAELRGTGTSFYTLRHPDVVEGGERVRVVVRDAVSGLELVSTPLTRDVDYTMRYLDGEVIMKDPLPSTSDSLFLATQNLTTTLGGNPVILVVDYDYRGQAGDGLGAVGAVAAEDTGLVQLGGGVIAEPHSGLGSYELASVSLGLRAPNHKRTYVKGEWAQSSGSDAESYYSVDGGRTFGTLGANCLSASYDPYACRQSGRAVRVEAGAELAEWLGAKTDVLGGNAYFQAADPGFAANGLDSEQGQLKFGAVTHWTASPRDSITLRHDSVTSDLAMQYDPTLGFGNAAGASLMKQVTRRFTGAQWQHKWERLQLVGELNDTFTGDSQTDQHAFVDTAVLGAAYAATSRLKLSLSQEGILRATDDSLLPRGADGSVSALARYTTTLGAEWKLADWLSLTGAESVRWNGENGTSLGVKAPIGDGADVYGTERFGYVGGQFLATSILGGEDRLAKGTRAYGEYQIDGAISDGSSRAVVGLANRWELMKGLFVSLNYERAQVYGTTTGAAGFGGFAAGPGASLGGGQVLGESQTASPGMSPAASCVPGVAPSPQQGAPATPSTNVATGTCAPSTFYGSSYNPAGGFFPGTTSRDAASGGFEYTLDHRFKASMRLELRLDNADPTLLGKTPGVADRRQLVTLNNVDWKWTDDLSFLARLNLVESQVADPSTNVLGTEARYLEGTFGLAFRPALYDRFAVLFKYTRLIDQRPYALTLGTSDIQTSDVVALSPTLELPLELALAEKFAYKHTHARVGDGPDEYSHTLLWVNRLDKHLFEKFDVSLEYRMLFVYTPDGAGGYADDGDRGFLVEAAYRPMKYLRVGAGYNFTSFTENELDRWDRSGGGFFLRATGMY